MKKHYGKITIIFLLTFLIAVLAMCFSISSESYSEGGITWNYEIIDEDAKTIKITGANISDKYTKEFKIPETITVTSSETEEETVYTVVEIGDSAFASTNIRNSKVFGNVTIPNTVTKIGAKAFTYTQIYGKVVIPESVVDRQGENGNYIYGIGESAFEGCKGVTEVVLPAGVTRIAPKTFKNCTILQAINTENITHFEEECFYKCSALYYLTSFDKAIDDGKAPVNTDTAFSKTTKIADKAFYECLALENEIDISTVTELGSNVFFNCERISGFTMPNCDFNIAFFAGCYGVKYFNVNSDNTKFITIDGVIFDKEDDGKTLLLYPANKKDKTYTIPSFVKYVDKAAFAYTRNIEKVVFEPDSVTGLYNAISIGAEAFKYSSLKTIYIPDSVVSVSVDMFKNCEDIELVVLGSNVKTVGVDSFKNANSNVVVIAKNPTLTRPDYVSENNFISADGYQCVNHYYGYLDKKATCTEDGYNECIVCGRVSHVEKLGHTGPIVSQTPQSCDTDESVEIRCIRCCKGKETVTVVNEAKKMTGHRTVNTYISATDKTPGYTISNCLKCHKTFIDNYTLPLSAPTVCESHDVVSVKISEASCKTNGLTIYYCKNCGENCKESTIVDKLPCDYELYIEIESSCTVKGHKTEICKVCGNMRVTEKELAPHAHSWYTIADKKGYEYSTCARPECGYFESREVDYSVLNTLIAQVSKYSDSFITGYEDKDRKIPIYSVAYYAPSTLAQLKPILENAKLNLTQEDVDYNVAELSKILANIEYNVTDVPVVFIEKNDNNLNKETYTDAKIYISYIDENGQSRVEAVEYDASIRIRGNSTSNGVKKPYNIKFSSNVDLFGMGSGKKYCLLANLFDQTQLRNALAIDFSQALDIQFSPSYKFVEVVFNGDNRGLYLLTTPMDIDENRIDIDEDNDFVIETENKSDGEFYLSSPLFQIDGLVEDTNKLSGKAYSNMYVNYYMLDFAIKSGDEEFIRQYCNMESLAKYFVLHEYLKDVDIYYDSTRYYMQDGKLHGGPVWDFDYALGNVKHGSTGGNDSSWSAYENASSGITDKTHGVIGQSATGIWANGAWAGNKNSWFCHLWEYSSEFQELVQGYFVEYVDAMKIMYEDKVITKYNVIKNNIDTHNADPDFIAARIRNYEIYDIAVNYNGHGGHMESSYKASITYLKNWLKQRHEWLYEYYTGETLPTD